MVLKVRKLALCSHFRSAKVEGTATSFLACSILPNVICFRAVVQDADNLWKGVLADSSISPVQIKEK
jgi:hypothetical protein